MTSLRWKVLGSQMKILAFLLILLLFCVPAFAENQMPAPTLGALRLGPNVLTVAPSGAQYTTVQAAVNAAVAAGASASNPFVVQVAPGVVMSYVPAAGVIVQPTASFAAQPNSVIGGAGIDYSSVASLATDTNAITATPWTSNSYTLSLMGDAISKPGIPRGATVTVVVDSASLTTACGTGGTSTAQHVIWLQAGTYTFAAQLAVPTYTTLYAATPNTAIITSSLSGASGAAAVVYLSASYAGLQNVAIVNSFVPTGGGTEGAGVSIAAPSTGCFVRNCDITCSEWCIVTDTSTDNAAANVASAMVVGNRLNGCNPFYPFAPLDGCNFSNNTGAYSGAGYDCMAIIDMTLDYTHRNNLITNNSFVISRASVATPNPYFVRLAGYGNRVIGNKLILSQDCGAQTYANLDLMMVVLAGSVPMSGGDAIPAAGVLDTTTNVVANNIYRFSLTNYNATTIKRLRGVGSTATGKASAPLLLINNDLNMAAGPTPSVASEILIGKYVNPSSTKGTSFLTPAFTVALGANALVGLDPSINDGVSNYNNCCSFMALVPQPATSVTVSALTAAAIQGGYTWASTPTLTHGLGYPPMLGAGWTGSVTVSGVTYPVICDGTNFYYLTGGVWTLAT